MLAQKSIQGTRLEVSQCSLDCEGLGLSFLYVLFPVDCIEDACLQFTKCTPDMNLRALLQFFHLGLGALLQFFELGFGVMFQLFDSSENDLLAAQLSKVSLSVVCQLLDPAQDDLLAVLDSLFRASFLVQGSPGPFFFKQVRIGILFIVLLMREAEARLEIFQPIAKPVISLHIGARRTDCDKLCSQVNPCPEKELLSLDHGEVVCRKQCY